MSLHPEEAMAHDGVPALDSAELRAMLPVVYDELRVLADRYLRGERPGHTLQPTALVHEAYMRMAGQHGVAWRDRAQVFAVAAEMMRRILVNHARDRHAAKRGGHATRVTLDESVSWGGERDVDLVALDDALTALAAHGPRQARIVELRFFGGLGIAETAEVLGISPATVKREWSVAKAWLRRELTEG